MTFRYHPQTTGIEDGVLIAVDASKDYLKEDQQQLSADGYQPKARDLNE